MRYAKRDTALPEMPKKTKYEAAYSAQRRAIDKITRKRHGTPELRYTDQDCPLNPDVIAEPPTGSTGRHW